MKIIDKETLSEIALPNDLLWTDELNWVSVVSQKQYTLTGALLVEQSVKQFGRPITLDSPDQELAWVSRATVAALRAAASIVNRKFTLVLEYPADTRQFTVMFDHEQSPVSATPVKGFPDHDADSYFRVKITLVEVQA